MATDRIPAGQGAWRFITGASLPATFAAEGLAAGFCLEAWVRPASMSRAVRVFSAPDYAGEPVVLDEGRYDDLSGFRFAGSLWGLELPDDLEVVLFAQVGCTGRAWRFAADAWRLPEDAQQARSALILDRRHRQQDDVALFDGPGWTGQGIALGVGAPRELPWPVRSAALPPGVELRRLADQQRWRGDVAHIDGGAAGQTWLVGRVAPPSALRLTLDGAADQRLQPCALPRGLKALGEAPLAGVEVPAAQLLLLFDQPAFEGDARILVGEATQLADPAPAADPATPRFDRRLICRDRTIKLNHPPAFSAAAAFTAEARFQWPLPTTDEWNTLFRGPRALHHVIVRKPDMALGAYFDGQFHTSSFCLNTLPPGDHHLAVVWSPGAGSEGVLRYFVDHAYVGAVPTAAATIESVDTIGGYAGGGQSFGPVWDVRLWTRSLAPAERWVEPHGERPALELFQGGALPDQVQYAPSTPAGAASVPRAPRSLLVASAPEGIDGVVAIGSAGIAADRLQSWLLGDDNLGESDGPVRVLPPGELASPSLLGSYLVIPTGYRVELRSSEGALASVLGPGVHAAPSATPRARARVVRSAGVLATAEGIGLGLELATGQSRSRGVVARFGGQQLREGGWHHVAVSWTGSELVQVLDGREVGRVAVAPALIAAASRASWRLGADLRGSIARVRVWRGARDAAAIREQRFDATSLDAAAAFAFDETDTNGATDGVLWCAADLPPDPRKTALFLQTQATVARDHHEAMSAANAAADALRQGAAARATAQLAAARRDAQVRVHLSAISQIAFSRGSDLVHAEGNSARLDGRKVAWDGHPAALVTDTALTGDASSGEIYVAIADPAPMVGAWNPSTGALRVVREGLAGAPLALTVLPGLNDGGVARTGLYWVDERNKLMSAWEGRTETYELRTLRPGRPRSWDISAALIGGQSVLVWSNGWEIWRQVGTDAPEIIVPHALSPHPVAVNLSAEGALVWVDLDDEVVRRLDLLANLRQPVPVDLYPAPKPGRGVATGLVPVEGETPVLYWVAADRLRIEAAVLDTPGLFLWLDAERTARAPFHQHVPVLRDLRLVGGLSWTPARPAPGPTVLQLGEPGQRVELGSALLDLTHGLSATVNLLREPPNPGDAPRHLREPTAGGGLGPGSVLHFDSGNELSLGRARGWTVEAQFVWPLPDLDFNTLIAGQTSHYVVVAKRGSERQLGSWGTDFVPSGFSFPTEFAPGLHHLAARFDGSTIHYFVDGEEVGQATRVIWTPIRYIGGFGTAGAQSFGPIWNVRVWGRVCTDAELRASAAGETPSAPTQLLLDLPLDGLTLVARVGPRPSGLATLPHLVAAAPLRFALQQASLILCLATTERRDQIALVIEPDGTPALHLRRDGRRLDRLALRQDLREAARVPIGQPCAVSWSVSPAGLLSVRVDGALAYTQKLPWRGDAVLYTACTAGAPPPPRAEVVRSGAMLHQEDPPEPLAAFRGWIQRLLVWNTAVEADELDRMASVKDADPNLGPDSWDRSLVVDETAHRFLHVGRLDGADPPLALFPIELDGGLALVTQLSVGHAALARATAEKTAAEAHAAALKAAKLAAARALEEEAKRAHASAAAKAATDLAAANAEASRKRAAAQAERARQEALAEAQIAAAKADADARTQAARAQTQTTVAAATAEADRRKSEAQQQLSGAKTRRADKQKELDAKRAGG